MLRILTLNVHKGFTTFHRRFVLHDLRDAIRTISADLVFLQEVVGDHKEHSTRYEQWPEEAQYEFLADTIWRSYAYGRNAVYAAGHHGNALLCKFPILRHANHDISITGSEGRGLLHAVLDVPGLGSPLHAICVHLGLSEAQRTRQITLLCDYLSSTVDAQAPLVVAGDFNDWRGRAHVPLRQKAGLHEVFVQSQGKAARTFPARVPLLRLDRIYIRHLRPSTAAVLSRRPWSHLSDHAALTAELERDS